VRAKIVLGLMLALMVVPVVANDNTTTKSLERALAGLVNDYALTAGMIVGERGATGACLLELNRNFQRNEKPQLAQAQSRIFRELELSNIQYDIRRFNAPRTLADGNLFKVDAECRPIQYLPQIPEFKPPTLRRAGELTVQYLAPAEDPTTIEIEVVTRSKTHVIEVVRGEHTDPPTGLNLALPRGPVVVGAEDLILKWNDSVLVDWSLGRWPLLRNFQPDAKTRIRVRSGSSVSEVGDVATATSGARVAFPEGAVLTLLRIGKKGLPEQQAKVSWRRSQTARALFTRDARGREFWGRDPTNFEAQIVQSLRTSTNRPNAVVTLTLQPQLDAQLREVLATAARSAAGPGKRWSGYGSIVLMDAVSGHFIAAAGYPTAPRPLRLPGDTVVADEGFREEFLKKRNIGSVAKAPIAYAIISTTPALVGLTMQPYDPGDQTSVLGIPVDKYGETGNSNCAERGRAEFECFLSKSLNRYAATLLTLAAVPGLDQSDPYARLRVGSGAPLGAEAVQLIDAAHHVDITQPPRDLLWARQPTDLHWTRLPTGEQLEGLAWVQYAKSEYDIDVALSSGTGYAALPVHGYMWRNAFVDGTGTAPSLQTIAPEKENLRLNQARDLRANYLQLILGGGESSWSSVKVAEIFARCVTGRRIAGSFVYGGDANWPSLKGEKDPAVHAAHNRYLAGLEAVFVSGTGLSRFGKNVSALKRRAQAGNLQLSIYAKSGTPTIERYVDAEEEDFLLPIDRAYRTQVLSAQRASDGWQISVRGKLIDAELLRNFPNDASLPADYAPLKVKHLRYLELFNGATPEDQTMMCDVGGTFQCRPPRDRPRNAAGKALPGPTEGYARNYAVYAELRNPANGKTCRAISMAVSFSEKSDAFTDMMNALLDPVNGVLSESLGLSGERPGMACDAAR
jgi:hypothetical protein